MARRKARRRRVKRAGRKVGRAPAVARSGGLGGAVAELNAYRRHLLADGAAIDEQVAAIDRALKVMGAAPARRAVARRRRVAGGRKVAVGRRAARPGSLKYFIGRVLTGRGVMPVKDIAGGVLKAGYRTNNKTLAKSVGIALTQMRDVRKVGRGRFKLK